MWFSISLQKSIFLIPKLEFAYQFMLSLHQKLETSVNIKLIIFCQKSINFRARPTWLWVFLTDSSNYVSNFWATVHIVPFSSLSQPIQIPFHGENDKLRFAKLSNSINSLWSDDFRNNNNTDALIARVIFINI